MLEQGFAEEMSEREQDADGPRPSLAVPGNFAMCLRWALDLRLVLSAVAVVAAVATGVCAASATASLDGCCGGGERPKRR